MINAELPIGTELFIDGHLCVVKEGNACSKCEIQKATSSRVSNNGMSMKCGTRNTGNTSDFLCFKDDRLDKKNIIFERVSHV